jgi:hypothetical protein
VDTSLVVDNTSGDDKTRIESQKTVQELHALEHVRTMAGWQMIDFIEISGGDYETPGMSINLTDSRASIALPHCFSL